MSKVMRLVSCALCALCSFAAVAASVTSDEAAQAVRTWIGLRAQLGCRLGGSVAGARTCSPTNGVSFHVVKLSGGGFVVTSADTEIEPILAFSDSDDLVESEKNPLWTMLRHDLAARGSSLRRRGLRSASSATSASTVADKWARLLPSKSTNGTVRLAHASTGKETLSDVRVAPLLQTKWSQKDARNCGTGDPCYNYYTPNNYPCGCVATAGAQIMRYHRYPTASVTPGTYVCEVMTGKDWISQYSYYPIYEDRNLTMQGGTYSWDSMPSAPADGVTLAQRQAIGKLTSDVGITCLMSYAEGGSSSGGYMLSRSLPERFGYANAVAACGNGLSAAFVRKVLVSNLDAKLPVMIGLDGSSGGHAVVADGYGYSMSTFYAHFNMGWAGTDDAWYAPPNVADDFYAIDSMVYNVYPSGVANGVICSGRVLSSSGSPVAGATVTASGDASATTTSDANGIYSFILSPGSYTISSGDASQSATLAANVGTPVTEDGYYRSNPAPAVNYVCNLDLTVSEEDPSPVVTHTVAFDLGTHGMRTGGGELSQTVLDGEAAVAPAFAVAEGWTFTGWSCDFSQVTDDLTVTAQYEAIPDEPDPEDPDPEDPDPADVTFETGGYVPWFEQSAVTCDGTPAWQVGDLTSGEYVTSWLSMTVQGPCTLSFQFGFQGSSSCFNCSLDNESVSLDHNWGDNSPAWKRNEIVIAGVGEHRLTISCSGWSGDQCAQSKYWVADVQRTEAPEGVTVSFDANGGFCETSELYYETGYEYGELPTPYRTQGGFWGWYTAAIGGQWVGEESLVRFDVERLYAHWGLPIEEALGVGEEVTVDVDTDWGTDDPEWYGNIDLSYDGEGCACAGFEDSEGKRFYATVNGPGTLSFVARCENSGLNIDVQKQEGEYSYTNYDLAWLYSANSYGNAQTCSVDGFKVSKSYTGGWVRFDIETYGAGEHTFEFYGYRQAVAGDSYALVDCMSWTPASGSPVVQFEYLDNKFLNSRIYSAGETYGSRGSLPVPTRTGYVFTGWCTDEDLLKQVDESDYVPFAGAHLYAKWTKTLAYDNENWYESEETYTTGDKVYRTDIVTNGCVETENWGTVYTYPTSYIEFGVSGAGFFSFWLASGGFATCTITVDGEQVGSPVYSYNYWSDELTLTNWEKQNLTISGSGKHTVRITATGNAYWENGGVVLVKGNEFEKYAQQSTFGGWSDKVRNHNCWITGNLPTLQKIYANDATPKGRVLHAIATLLTACEDKSFQSLFKGFGYTIDYMTMQCKGTRSYASAPTANKIVDTLITVGEPLVKTALADLEAIPSTMAEFDLTVDDCAYFDEGVKIDYGDILYMRAALKGLLGFAYWSKAYNVEIDYDQMQKDGYGVSLQTVKSESSLKTEAAWDNVDWLAPCSGEGMSGRSPFKAVKSGSSIYVYAPHEEGEPISTCYIAFVNSATGKNLSGYYYNSDDWLDYFESTVALVADFDGGSVFRLNVSQFSGVKIANVYLESIGSTVVKDGWTATSCSWSATSVDTERFILHQTKIMDKVRTASALTTAKNCVREGLRLWREADAKVAARTCDCLHLIEYDPDDEVAARNIAAWRENLPKALQALNDGSVQEYDWINVLPSERAPEKYANTLADPLAIDINKLFTGEITRSVLPSSDSTDYYVPTIYEMDPMVHGLLPETTRSQWADFLDVKGVERSTLSQYEFGYYVNDDETTVTLTGIVGKAPTGALDIPAEVDGYAVSAIGDGFLEGASGITSVTVPEGVLEIGREAFAGCTALTTVTFPSTLYSIGEVPFLSCKSLKTVNLLGSEPSVAESMYWLNEGSASKLVPATTYVQPGIGWNGIVEGGSWMGRPIVQADPYFGVALTTGSEGYGTVSGGGTYKIGSLVTLTATESEDGAFLGWYSDPDCEYPVTVGESVYREPNFVFEADEYPMTFYARFADASTITYDISFDANGGWGEMDGLYEIAYGEQVQLPPCAFECGELRFMGWSLEPDGEVSYRDGATVSRLTVESGSVVTLYAVWREVPDGFAFGSNETRAEKGGAFELIVYGGSEANASSVKLNVSYANAKASDLALKNALVRDADGNVEQRNLKLPLTLTWKAGDLEPKTVVIPTAAGKKTDAPKYLTWNLSDAKGLDISEYAYCIGTISEGEDYNGSDICVLPYVTDFAGGKVSGGASVARDTKGKYKAVTLKASANKNYWFAGWFDACGEWVSSDLSLKVTPDGNFDPMTAFEARFVSAHTSLVGTYNGYARVNLKGMTIVKGADTSSDVYGEYPLTATLSKDGKLSGSVTVGGKKVSFKADACCEASETDDTDGASATYRFVIDEKAWFGKANSETLQIGFSRWKDENGFWSEYGVARLGGVSSYEEEESADASPAPLGDEQSGFAYLNIAKADADLIKPFAGTHTACLTQEDGGVIPLSVSIDKSGKVKATGYFLDGTALTASGTLAYRYCWSESSDSDVETGESALVHLFVTPKSLGSGGLHLTVIVDRYSTSEGVNSSASVSGALTCYTASSVAAPEELWSDAVPFSVGCWIPKGADPDFGVVRLTSGEDQIDISYTSKSGVITGLGKTIQSGFTVKFDAKTGLLSVAKGKDYTIQGVLGDNSCEESCAAGRVNKNGSVASATVEFTTLPQPEENFPWTNEGFVLTLGQCYADGMQPSVTSDGSSLGLAITGLPSGLKYDKKTGLITGAPTKAGKSTVKVSYTYGTQKITRTTEFVVAAKPADLPVGTYAGTALVGIGGDYENTPVSYPFTATIDKKGALSGSITLFGKKVTLKASGYDYRDEYGQFRYSATLDLKAVGKSWGTLTVTALVSADSIDFDVSDSFGSDLILAGATAYRNQTKDSGFANRVKPYVGTYLVALDTCSDDAALSGVSTLSIVVDKKGGAKLAGTFADGSTFSASGALSLLQDGDIEWACLAVSVVPKSLAQGAFDLDVRLSLETDEESADQAVSVSCSASAAKYVLKDDAYSGYGLEESFAYAYSSLAWVDSYVRASSTCLSVTSDMGIFDEACYAWKTKMNPICGPEIVGVDKMISGPKGMTFKLDDKTGFFSGTYAGGKFFGAMAKGACSGIGTAVGKDGSISRVTVGAAYRSE